ncbi:hypothetical protein Unana1_04165 [Umbelopsis nana]
MSSATHQSTAVKRILQEAKELQQDPSVEYTARPLDENIFEWHFTVSGPVGTEFDGGRYHGRILLPNEYPFKPPEVIFLTSLATLKPNGRFELNKKICLSITGYHPEYWQPAWGVRTVMLGVMGFFPTRADGSIGGIDYGPEERKKLARSSRSWACTACQVSNIELLPDIPESGSKSHTESTNASDVPQFSFAYADNKNGQSDPAVNEVAIEKETNDDNDSEEESGEHAPANNDQIDSTEVEATPVVSEEIQHTSNATTNNARSEGIITEGPPSAGRSQAARTADSRSQPHRSNPRTVSSPRWLDALIIGLVAVLIGLVIRRFL